MISAGSVVGKDVPEGAFVGGNPARNLTSLAQKAWAEAAGRDGSIKTLDT